MAYLKIKFFFYAIHIYLYKFYTTDKKRKKDPLGKGYEMFQFIGFIILMITNLIGMVLSLILTIVMLPFYAIGILLAVIGVGLDKNNHQNRINY